MDIPDDEGQDELIQLFESDPDSFKTKICEIINNNLETFNILELNQNNDETDTNMNKESFANRFDGILKPQLLNTIYDAIDINKTNNITNATLLNFVNNKTKHPRHQTTKIVRYFT